MYIYIYIYIYTYYPLTWLSHSAAGVCGRGE